MSVHVKHLNADSSFYLTFSPAHAPHAENGELSGSFTVLIDPWLSGASKILSPRFAQSLHTVPACVRSLADLPDPDLVVVSQDKSDHCHLETLQQLSAKTNAIFLGPAGAVKKIRGLKYFEPENVRCLSRYEGNKPDTLFRIAIPPSTPNGSSGEVTIALLASKFDIKGLHNAIGITYRPPSTGLSDARSQSYIDLPLTPPESPPASLASVSSRHLMSSTNVSTISAGTSALNRERTLSLLYSPHGVDFSVVKPYACDHLMTHAALPLTAMFHSMDRATNPWYFGGNICAGTPGGIELATNLLAKHWISAHDEDKANSGVSVRNCKVVKYDMDHISQLIDHGFVNPSSSAEKPRLSPTRLHCLDSGEELFISGRW